MRHERSGITGKIVERELFGKSRYQEVTGEQFEDFKFREPEQAFEFLKTLQPFPDPTKPGREFAYMVHRYVFKMMGLDASQLCFYTAIDSSLDRYQGIDGWFEANLSGGGTRVSIDLTTNPEKERGKADIVFLVPHDGLALKVDKEQFMSYSRELAIEIVEFFKQQGVSPERGDYE